MTNNLKKIESALISVYYKDGLDAIANELAARGVKIYSTGGTYDYLANNGFEVEKVEDIVERIKRYNISKQLGTPTLLSAGQPQTKTMEITAPVTTTITGTVT
jgi:hypothetical protein